MCRPESNVYSAATFSRNTPRFTLLSDYSAPVHLVNLKAFYPHATRVSSGGPCRRSEAQADLVVSRYLLRPDFPETGSEWERSASNGIRFCQFHLLESFYFPPSSTERNAELLGGKRKETATESMHQPVALFFVHRASILRNVTFMRQGLTKYRERRCQPDVTPTLVLAPHAHCIAYTNCAVQPAHLAIDTIMPPQAGESPTASTQVIYGGMGGTGGKGGLQGGDGGAAEGPTVSYGIEAGHVTVNTILGGQQMEST
ncbi:hypothetical protein B0H14DRAFT_3150480, partial [Mycena olivaceomarginata]